VSGVSQGINQSSSRVVESLQEQLVPFIVCDSVCSTVSNLVEKIFAFIETHQQRCRLELRFQVRLRCSEGVPATFRR
jgi:hypothetical protein